MTTAAEQRAQRLSAELERFVQIVVEHMHPERIILFESFANGQIHEWSDLDLVVVAETDLPFYERLKQAILLVQARVGMDVVIYTPDEWERLKRERLFIREEIAGKGKVVYERDRSGATPSGMPTRDDAVEALDLAREASQVVKAALAQQQQ